MTLKIPDYWTFKDPDVAKHFDHHVREQLPWYDLVSEAIVSIARNYVPLDGLVYDFGCSTGNIGRRLQSVLLAQNARLIAIDHSLEIGRLYTGGGRFICEELQDFTPEPFDVGICFLTMMFMSRKNQEIFYRRLIKQVNVGGCLIFVEKQESVAGYPSSVLWRMIQEMKLKQGVQAEDVFLKEMSLIGRQRPVSRSLPELGIPFFQFGDFIGWFCEIR